MIVVQIHSGLGNQLFMYAAARALAQRRNTPLFLDVDTDCREGRNFGAHSGHTFQLDKFHIRAAYLGMANLKNAGSASAVGVYSAVKAQLRGIAVLRRAVRPLPRNGIDVSKMAKKPPGTRQRLFTEARGDWGYKPHFLDLPDETILRGCFFSFRYFDWLRNDLRSELTLKEGLSLRSQEIEAEILARHSVSLHVRRGDVVTNPEYRSWYEGVVTDRYYRNAIAHFMERLDHPHFFVFSDDMAWTKENLRIPGQVTYVDHNGPDKGYEDLHLMSRCKHNVTAGFSSFSWWAAYLNPHPQKTVIRTERMNGLDALNHPQDFFPPDWIVVRS